MARYERKRAALHRLNPIDLRERWLRLSRAALLLAAALLVRLTFSTLPAFDIEQVHDVLAAALPPAPAIALTLYRVLALLPPLLALLAAVLHFLTRGDSAYLPLALFFFHAAKFLSDVSLHVRPPPGAALSHLCRGNVDGGTGLALIALCYFLRLPRSSGRALAVLGCALAAALAAFVRLALRATYSYALLAAVLVAGFAHTLGQGLVEAETPFR